MSKHTVANFPFHTCIIPAFLQLKLRDNGKKKRVCQNSFSAKDSYHFVKNYRYQRVNNSMITVTLIFMRE